MDWNTRVTELLNITYPIIQGGLAHLAYADLASAVSNAGGLGQITAMSMGSPEELRREIKRMKTLTNQPFGVNFAIGQHGRPYQDMVETAIEEKVSVISITGGNPAPVLELVEGTGIKTLVLVAAKRQAEKAEELGADAVMVVGHEGGGHIGRDGIGTFILTPQVAETVSIPVIASGGIGDGKGLMAALALGAEGIEMGTRFIATKECVHAHDAYKQALVAADERSTSVIKKSLLAPARALTNSWTDKILQLEESQPGYDALKSYISGEANQKYIYEGLIDEGFAWAGQITGRIHDVPSVKELFERIIRDSEQIRKTWA